VQKASFTCRCRPEFVGIMSQTPQDRDDPITEIVATAIIGIADRGERDPALIKERALNAIGARKSMEFQQ
jgi:hypothetical protein